MARYGMVIDLQKCCGCGGCVLACKVEHTTPPGISWLRLWTKEYGQYPNVSMVIMPLQCNHCKDAPCVEVCPTGATTKRPDGVVSIDYSKCIGCQSCIMACPYGSRYYYKNASYYFPDHGPRPFEDIGYKTLQTGVVLKCDFCLEKIETGIKKGLRPGIDQDATPSCVTNCMTKARYFGDLDDPHSEVNHLIQSHQGRQIHPEFGTDPSIFYIN